MLGFVKADKSRRRLGGEVFHENKRRQNLLFIFFGLIAFVILNFILYSLSSF